MITQAANWYFYQVNNQYMKKFSIAGEEDTLPSKIFEMKKKKIPLAEAASAY